MDSEQNADDVKIIGEYMQQTIDKMEAKMYQSEMIDDTDLDFLGKLYKVASTSMSWDDSPARCDPDTDKHVWRTPPAMVPPYNQLCVCEQYTWGEWRNGEESIKEARQLLSGEGDSGGVS